MTIFAFKVVRNDYSACGMSYIGDGLRCPSVLVDKSISTFPVIFFIFTFFHSYAVSMTRSFDLVSVKIY